MLDISKLQLFSISLIVLSLSSCGINSPKNEFQNNHNLIGIWSIGSIQYKQEELLGWVYVNVIEFYESDSIWLSEYPESRFPKYGKYRAEFVDGEVSKVEIVTKDTLYSGIYDVTWREYYTTPRARDSILAGVVLESENTLIWLNSRLTGWRK